MGVGAWVGIGIAIFIVVMLIIAFLTAYIMSKKCEFVCDACGHVYKIGVWELLLSPSFIWKVSSKCPKCGEYGAHLL